MISHTTQWATRLRTEPERFVLEEYVPLSHVPVWDGGRFESRALMMRVFLAADGHGDYCVMNGGLARIGGNEREDAGGEERDDPASERGEVREDADIVEAGAECEQRRHASILCHPPPSDRTRERRVGCAAVVE